MTNEVQKLVLASLDDAVQSGASLDDIQTITEGNDTVADALTEVAPTYGDIPYGEEFSVKSSAESSAPEGEFYPEPEFDDATALASLSTDVSDTVQATTKDDEYKEAQTYIDEQKELLEIEKALAQDVGLPYVAPTEDMYGREGVELFNGEQQATIQPDRLQQALGRLRDRNERKESSFDALAISQLSPTEALEYQMLSKQLRDGDITGYDTPAVMSPEDQVELDQINAALGSDTSGMSEEQQLELSQINAALDDDTPNSNPAYDFEALQNLSSSELEEFISIERELGRAGDSDFIRGIDELQGTLGKGVQAFGEIIGSENITQYGKGVAARNEIEAALSAPEAEGFIDGLQQMFPTLGAYMAPALAGGAIGSVGGPVGAGVGAMTGIALSGLPLNLGFAKDLEEELSNGKENSLADGGTLATAISMTGIDMLGGGVTTNVAKGVLKNAIKETIKKQSLRGAGKGALIGAGTAGGQQLALDVGSTQSAGAEFDEERLDAMADNMAASLAFGGAIGGAIGGIGSGAIGGLERLRELQDASYMKYMENVHTRLNETERYLQASKELEAGPSNTPGVYETINSPYEISSVVPEEPGILKEGIFRVFGRAVTPLMRHYESNPHMRKMVNLFDQNHSQRRDAFDVDGTPIASLGVKTALYSGKHRQTMNRLSALSKDAQEDIAIAIREGKATSGLAKDVLDMNRAIYQDAERLGLTPGDRGPTWLPFVPNRSLIRKDPDSFYQAIMGDENIRVLSPKEKAAFDTKLKDYIDEIVNDGGVSLSDPLVLGSDDLKMLTGLSSYDAGERIQASKSLENRIKGDAPESIKIRRSNALELSRKIGEVSQETLDAWSEGTLAHRLNDYMNATSERFAFADSFGASGEKLMDMLYKFIQHENEAGRVAQVKDIQRVVDIANASQRNYRRIQDPNIRNWNKRARAYQYIRTLPMGLIQNFIEPLLIFEGIGAKPALMTMKKTVSEGVQSAFNKVFRTGKTSKADMNKVLSDVDVSYRNAVSAAAQKYDADTFNITKLEEGFFKATQIPQWTEFNRSWGAEAAHFSILDKMRKLRVLNDQWETNIEGGIRATPKSSREIAKLTNQLLDAGIHPGKALEWLMKYSDDGSGISPAAMDDPFYKNDFLIGVTNLVDDVVLRPNATNRPLWQSDERLALVSQLKGYPMLFQNRVMNRWIDKIKNSGPIDGSTNVAKGLVFMGTYMGGMAMIRMMKDLASNGEVSDRSWNDSLLDAASQLGALGMVANTFTSAKYGTDPLTTNLGPTVSQGVKAVKEVGRVITSTSDSQDGMTAMDILASDDPNVAEKALFNITFDSIPRTPGYRAVREVAREAWFNDKESF